MRMIKEPRKQSAPVPEVRQWALQEYLKRESRAFHRLARSVGYETARQIREGDIRQRTA